MLPVNEQVLDSFAPAGPLEFLHNFIRVYKYISNLEFFILDWIRQLDFWIVLETECLHHMITEVVYFSQDSFHHLSEYLLIFFTV